MGVVIKPAIDAERISQIRALHSEGKSNSEVAAAVGVSRSTVSKYAGVNAHNGSNGASPDDLEGPSVKPNGHADASALLAAIEAEADVQWRGFDVARKVRAIWNAIRSA